MLKILNQFDQNIQKGATWHAFYCLVFTAFLWVGEFIYSKQNMKNSVFKMWHFIRQFVILQKNKLTLSLSASKTDPFKKDVTLPIATADDRACAVASLKHLFINFFTISNSFLFQAFAEIPFTRDTFVDKIKKILLQYGFWKSYSEHLFKKRIGSPG